MNDRPNTSIWGTILSCVEIAINIYQIIAEKGQGLMIPEDKAKTLLSDKAVAQGQCADCFIHYEGDSLGEDAAVYELIKSGHITDPEILGKYEAPEEIEAAGRFLNPDYFGNLPEPKPASVFGEIKAIKPIDNGVYFMACNRSSGIAVHKTVADYTMSDYARNAKHLINGDYHYYDLNESAAIAIFELSASHPKVHDLITSWDSLMYTLYTQFPAYADFWNSHVAEAEHRIVDVPAPLSMFLQQQLDEAAHQPTPELEPDATEHDQTDDFFEMADSFEGLEL